MSSSDAIEMQPINAKKKQTRPQEQQREVTEYDRIKLHEEFARERLYVSQAANDLIDYCEENKDLMVPSRWGKPEEEEYPYARRAGRGCCCIVM